MTAASEFAILSYPRQLVQTSSNTINAKGPHSFLSTEAERVGLCGDQVLSVSSVIHPSSLHFQILLDLLQMYQACKKIMVQAERLVSYRLQALDNTKGKLFRQKMR